MTKKEKKKFYSLILANIFISALDILSLALMVFIIVFYTQSYTPKHLSFIPAVLLDKNSYALLYLFFFLFLVKSIAGYIIFHAQFRLVYNVAAHISTNNLTAYLEGNYSNYINTPPAKHVRHISDHPIQFAHYVLFGLHLLATEFILVLITLIGILLFNASLFLTLFILLLPPVVLVALFNKRRLKAARLYVKETSATSLQYLHEALNSYIESNLYHKRPFFTKRFYTQQKRYTHYISDVHIAQGFPTRVIEVFAITGLLILIMLSKYYGSNSTYSLINIGACMVVAYKLIPGIVKISNLSAQLKTYEFITTDLLQMKLAPQTTIAIAEPIKNIAFDKVWYTHNLHAKKIQINFAAQQGDMVGISGSSGKGKTTFLNLLLGFLTPDEGMIEINGKATDPITRQQYWKNIAYVKQQTFLMHDTVLKNITFSDEDHDEEKLNRVLHISGLQQIVSQWPEGIHKTITDNGKNISGGQRQRIAIARALYKDADVIILDEPFNELDNSSENMLLEYLQQLAKQGKIILLVTHNTSSLSYCNKVIEIKDNN